MPERRGHHPDDLVDVLVDAQRPPDDVRIAAEPAPPQPVADHRDGGDARNLVALVNVRPTAGVGAEQVEIVRAGEEHFDAFRPIAAGQVRADRPDAGNCREDARSAVEVLELRLRQADVAQPESRVVGADPHQRPGIRKGQRLEEDAVDDGIDGRGGGDADGERASRRKRKQGVAQHPAQREPDVLQQSHPYPPCGVQSTAGASGSSRNSSVFHSRRGPEHPRGMLGNGQWVSEIEKRADTDDSARN